jgi:glycosyltransferase involved in cell wall biosynthesis
MTQQTAIAFGDEAYQTAGPRLMGAHAASEAFLRAYLKHGGAETLLCYAATRRQYEGFVERVRAVGGTLPCEWVSPLVPERLREWGTLYHPDPDIAVSAWLRRRFDPAAFSLVGVTHTTCSDSFLDLAGSWTTAPIEPWDAIICTSQAVLATVTQVYDLHEHYLRSRLGATRFVRPALPVIPLGVDLERIPSGERAQAFRRTQRAALGIRADDVAFLFFGRLSYHAKAHPLPMFLALEAAAQRTTKRLHLILAGWFANQAIQDAFLQGAQEFMPSVALVVVDGRRPDVREQIWSAADVFTSLSDNIQETFGLTPVEAMAARLPVVISDWNGYRDTVEHARQGFLVPTTLPPPGCGEDIVARFFAGADTYDRYIAHQSQCTAVDVAKCSEYYSALIENAELRREMGAAGRARAENVYSWAKIIGEYQELWGELAKIRAADGNPVQSRPPGEPWHPLRPDPLTLFSAYATQHLTDDVRVQLTCAPSAAEITRLYRHALTNFAGLPFVLLPPDEGLALVQELTRGPRSVAEIKSQFPKFTPAAVRTVGWLMKCGIVCILPERTV